MNLTRKQKEAKAEYDTVPSTIVTKEQTTMIHVSPETAPSIREELRQAISTWSNIPDSNMQHLPPNPCNTLYRALSCVDDLRDKLKAVEKEHQEALKKIDLISKKDVVARRLESSEGELLKANKMLSKAEDFVSRSIVGAVVVCSGVITMIFVPLMRGCVHWFTSTLFNIFGL